VDLAAQEDAKRFVWSGNGLGTVILSGPPADLSRQHSNGLALAIDWRVDTPPAGPVALSFGDRRLDITDAARVAQRDRVGTTHVPLRCFNGADFAKVGFPFSLATEGAFGVTIARVRLEPIAAADTCPTAAR
jgi:beta-glucosidase